MVFTDWNGNGLQEAGENPVQGVPLRLDPLGRTETGKNGEFVFHNVPDGLHDVGLDLGALPIDFDAPSIPKVQVALSGKDTLQVAFGLIPLGAIRGRVVRDLNGNGMADRDEPAIEGAVVVLDEGRRSERSKRGQFAFEAVPSGEHTVTLLSESLPEGAMIAGRGDARRNAPARSHGDRSTVPRRDRDARRDPKGVSGNDDRRRSERRTVRTPRPERCAGENPDRTAGPHRDAAARRRDSRPRGAADAGQCRAVYAASGSVQRSAPRARPWSAS